MKTQSRILLFLLCAGIDLCYLYACTTFATTLFFHRTFPFPEAVGSFILAGLLTLLSDGRGWRVIYVVAFQAIGFLPPLWRMTVVFGSWSDSFMTNTWLTDFFAKASDVVQYFVFVLLIVWTLVFWASGVDFARRPKNHATIVSRFDRGLVAFFVLFLTKFYLQAAQGISVDDPLSGPLVIPFFIFSLLAIGLERNQNSTERNFLPGFQTFGVMFGFVVVVLVAGTGLILFFLPYMTLVAQKGNDLLGIISSPLMAAAFALTDWLFGTDFSSNNLSANPEQSPAASVQWSIPWWTELIGRIVASGILILVVVVLLAVIGGLLYSVILWLVAPTARDGEKPSLRKLPAQIAHSISAWLRFLRRVVMRNVSEYSAIRLYAALRSWGHRSRLPHFPNETPTEYGTRLMRRFPILEKEFHKIIDAFNRQVYGEMDLSEQQLTSATAASRKLASPAYWSMRIKAWFQNQNMTDK